MLNSRAEQSQQNSLIRLLVIVESAGFRMRRLIIQNRRYSYLHCMSICLFIGKYCHQEWLSTRTYVRSNGGLSTFKVCIRLMFLHNFISITVTDYYSLAEQKVRIAPNYTQSRINVKGTSNFTNSKLLFPVLILIIIWF